MRKKEGRRNNKTQHSMLQVSQFQAAALSLGSSTAVIEKLRRPPPIQPDRHRQIIQDILHRVRIKREAIEITLYNRSEGKFLGIDPDARKQSLGLLEGDRFVNADCAMWRMLPGDRKDNIFLLQNCFSNCYIGICPQGNVCCQRKQPKEEERLQLICHEESGLMVIIIPHWHWQRGAPVCFRGAGKRNSKLWDCETRFLMDLSKTKHWENPMRSLRVGYGGQKDNSKTSGARVCQFQVVWRHPMKEYMRKQGPTSATCDESEPNWLGLDERYYQGKRQIQAVRSAI